MILSFVKDGLQLLCRALAWLFFALSGLSFWVGGRALHEFWHVGRIVAEFEGIGIAILSLLLGFGFLALSGPD